MESICFVHCFDIDYPAQNVATHFVILTKVLAKRLEKVLPRLKNPDQTGNVKGRYIGENSRLMQDLMF